MIAAIINKPWIEGPSASPAVSLSERLWCRSVEQSTATAMGVARRESGVLKLVHPGGFVEVHRKPVPASEIMAKNPRHYVTRPEVFKNPRLVLRPDAQLNTGDVFYIVPNHTVYRLLLGARSEIKHACMP